MERPKSWGRGDFSLLSANSLPARAAALCWPSCCRGAAHTPSSICCRVNMWRYCPRLGAARRAWPVSIRKRLSWQETSRLRAAEHKRVPPRGATVANLSALSSPSRLWSLTLKISKTLCTSLKRVWGCYSSVYYPYVSLLFKRKSVWSYPKPGLTRVQWEDKFGMGLC